MNPQTPPWVRDLLLLGLALGVVGWTCYQCGYRVGGEHVRARWKRAERIREAQEERTSPRAGIRYEQTPKGMAPKQSQFWFEVEEGPPAGPVDGLPTSQQQTSPPTSEKNFLSRGHKLPT